MQRIAVLYQALEPPVINGVRKPKKPGGYQDSSADIAYVLESQNIDVLTPVKSPDPLQKEDWCFPDTEEGILSAVQQGATHLWANTILFASHPLQTSRLLNEHGDIRIVGQPPQLVEQLDDKNYVNTLLRSKKIFNMPQSWTIEENASFDISSLTYPIVGKPVRGRGSHGVKLCQSPHELADHLRWLFEESPTIILEQYLFGQEGTITIMPPSLEIPRYWAMPIVVRFNHEDGIAPYSGVVAVTSNSRVPSKSETEQDNAFAEIGRECERAAELLHVTAPIRIDVRRYKDEPRSTFAIFDVNMKPNMTGPGRPGRQNQASLTALAAVVLGWDYPELLKRILATARSLKEIRTMTL